MKIVTFITDAEHPNYVNLLAASCRYHDLELVPLLGKERIKPSRCDRIANWFVPRERGFQIKDALLSDYLDGLADTELVLATDGYDAFFVAGEEEIAGKFAAFGKPVVFSAERICHPDGTMSREYPDAPSEMRFLNGGGFMGRTKDLRRALDLVRKIPCPSRYSWSSQYRWSRLFLERPDLIALDYQSSLFFCAAVDKIGTTWDPEFWTKQLISQNRVRLENGNRPCHLHFNGPISKQLETLSPALKPLFKWLE